MTSDRLKVKAKVERLGRSILHDINGFVHQDPNMLMREATEKFEAKLREEDVDFLFTYQKQLKNTSEGDTKLEYEQQWEYGYFFPLEMNGKDAPFTCEMRFNNFWFETRMEVSGSMDCNVPSSKQAFEDYRQKVYGETREQLLKKEGKWILDG